MIIDLDPTHRIKGTESCWQLEKLAKVKDEMQWKAYKWFTSMNSALHSAAQRELRTDPAHGIAEAFAAIRRLKEKYAAIFDDVGRRAA